MPALIQTTDPIAGLGAARTLVERQALAYLEPLSQRQGSYLRELGTYNGELDTEEGTVALFNRLLGAQPAVLISTGIATHRPASTSALIWHSTFEVVVIAASAHMRSREAAREGDEAGVLDPGADPGVWAILADCMDYLAGRQGPGPSKYFDPQREAPIMTAPELTLWQQVYTIVWTWEVLSDADRQQPGVVTEVLHRHNDPDAGEPPNPIAEGSAS